MFTINFKKIIKIFYSGFLLLVDSDHILYFLRDDGFSDENVVNNACLFSLNEKKYSIVKYSSVDEYPIRCKKIISACHHLDVNECSCDPKYRIIFFENSFHVHEKLCGISTYYICRTENLLGKDYENITDYHVIGEKYLLFINESGETYIFEFFHKDGRLYKISNQPKIKVVKKINIKSANNMFH